MVSGFWCTIFVLEVGRKVFRPALLLLDFFGLTFGTKFFLVFLSVFGKTRKRWLCLFSEAVAVEDFPQPFI